MSHEKGYESLKVWQDSMDLAVEIYDQVREWRDFGLRDQIRRAAVSVPSNIAEGYERHSSRETIQFLHIAKGSCAEVRTQLQIAVRVKQLEQDAGEALIETTRSVSAMLVGLIKAKR